jgi:hypothetical protein
LLLNHICAGGFVIHSSSNNSTDDVEFSFQVADRLLFKVFDTLSN